MGAFAGFDANPALSRLVAERSGIKEWIVPGQDSVCTVQALPGGGGSVGCGTAHTHLTGHTPLGSITVGPWTWRPYRRVLFVMLPDGSHSARLERHGKITRAVPLVHPVLVRTRSSDRVSWVAPDGTRHAMRIH
jgi:hypothetical protein